MWKKPELERPTVESGSLPETKWESELPQQNGAHQIGAQQSVTPQKNDKGALIGASIAVEGTIQGSEDLTIQGSVKGTINLKENVVTVGKNGRVEADIYGRTVIIDGDVVGNVFGQEQVVIHRTGNVRGNIVCARVTLEDGARIKGSVDTDSRDTAEGRPEAKKFSGTESDTTKKANGSLFAQ